MKELTKKYAAECFSVNNCMSEKANSCTFLVGKKAWWHSAEGELQKEELQGSENVQ